MTQEIKLVAEIREGEGRGTRKSLSAIRAAAKIPGVIYGGAKPPVKVTLSARDLLAARRRGGVNAILRLSVGESEETVIVKDLQIHPVHDGPIHVDLQRINLSRMISAKVPLRVVGEAPGVKLAGGVLEIELRDLSIRALPARIPQHIDVDVSKLEIGKHLLVKDLAVAQDLEVLDSPDHIVAHVTLVKVEVAEVAAPVAGAEVAPAAEPEVASTKGKKDEEGKLVVDKIAKAAAGAPPAKEKEAAKK